MCSEMLRGRKKGVEMKKTILPLLITALCLTACTSGEKPPTYYEIREQHGLDIEDTESESISSSDSADQNKPNSSSASSVPAYDKFVYRLKEDPLEWLGDGMPLKVNLTSGKTTTACIDPLCMHDNEECPFFDCTGSMIDGKILFYRRGWLQREDNGYSGTEKLCTYHVATGEVHVLEEYSDSLVFLGAFDDILYYYTAEWGVEGDELVCSYRLHRADGENGKVTELHLPETYKTVGGFTDSRDYPNILMVDGKTMYWYKYNADMTATFYTSDLNADNWQKIEEGVKTFANIYHNGYGYSIGADMEMIDSEAGFTKDNFTYSYYLVRRKLGDKEPERIADNIGSSNFIVTDRYVFYLEGLSDTEGLQMKKDPYSFGTSSGTEFLNGCRVWRMNHDGSEKMLVAETDDYFFAGAQYKHDEVLFGYYEDEENTWLALFFMEKNEDGDLVLSSDTLILDTALKQFIVSKSIE